MEELRRDLKKKRMKQEQLRNIAEKVTAVPSGMPGAPISDPHRKESVYTKLLELEQEIDLEVDKLNTMESTLYHNLLKLPDMRYLHLIEGRYIECMSWDELAEHLGYSRRYTFKLHLKALDEMKKF